MVGLGGLPPGMATGVHPGLSAMTAAANLAASHGIPPGAAASLMGFPGMQGHLAAAAASMGALPPGFPGVMGGSGGGAGGQGAPGAFPQMGKPAMNDGGGGGDKANNQAATSMSQTSNGDRMPVNRTLLLFVVVIVILETSSHFIDRIALRAIDVCSVDVHSIVCWYWRVCQTHTNLGP